MAEKPPKPPEQMSIAELEAYLAALLSEMREMTAEATRVADLLEARRREGRGDTTPGSPENPKRGL